MRQIVALLAATAVAFICNSDESYAFTTPSIAHGHVHQPPSPSSSTSTWMSSASDEAPPNIVTQDAFVTAIDVIKKDMGMEIIPEDQRPMYAIGKLVAQLPLELVSGIRFADCETLTLISQLKQSVVDATGMQSLDTIVAIRAGGDGSGGYGYEGITNGGSISVTAEAYTAAVNYAMQNNLEEIELELNRLVPMMPSSE
mmetsp:Transcript_45130/g.94661  ORF Transcript_45130/g.94661 Transcript_45130/m.94661 type:complete len:199 (-) Transcript_45130:37-633(-)